MSKRLLCGFLCLVFVFMISPWGIRAEEPPPMVEPMVAPVEEPIVDPIADPMTDLVVTPVEEPVTEQIVEPTMESIVEPVAVPMVEPIVEEEVVTDLLAPVAEPIVEPVIENVETEAVETMATPIEPSIGSPIGPQLVVSEVMAGTEVNPDKDVWIELFNPTDQAVSLDGWKIKGVTLGGSWIDVSDAPGMTIQPGGYFLLSYYTDSRYSALAVKPDVQKASLLFPNPLIQIELRNPLGIVVDKAQVEKSESDFRAFEREMPSSDGSLPENWERSVWQTNIKSGLAKTFGTPRAENPTNPPTAAISNQEILTVLGLDSADQETVEIVATEATESIDAPSLILNAEAQVASPLVSNAETIVSKSYVEGDLRIESVFPNPSGKDEGNEKITLKNNRHETINLRDWKLENLKGKRFAFGNVAVDPLSRWSFDPSTIKLTLMNKADRLTLIDPAGNWIDAIEWSNAGEGLGQFHPKFLADGTRAKITRVVDGDTFQAEIEELPFTVRLIGVDTPETVHPLKGIERFGKEASDHLANRLTEKMVSLSFEPQKMDKYGRLLAYVNVDGSFVNAELIEKGFGIAYTRFPFQFSDNFIKLETMARQNKVGLWADSNANSWIKEIKGSDEEWTESEQKDVPEEMEVRAVQKKADKDEKMGFGESPCPIQGLQIETILPNPKRGEAVEFIRLVNVSDRTVCLDGWKLDDQTDGGSKPFEFKGGAMESGALRTFRKNETGLSLNNENDCASLINPLGESVDRICYGKTHPNEQFTHEGGDWKPKGRLTKASPAIKMRGTKSRTPTKAPRMPQPYPDFLSSLATQSMTGTVQWIDPGNRLLYFQTNGKTMPVSYGQSNVDMASVTQMLDVGSTVTLALRNAGEAYELVAIRLRESASPIASCKAGISIEWQLTLAFMGLVIAALGTHLRLRRI